MLNCLNHGFLYDLLKINVVPYFKKGISFFKGNNIKCLTMYNDLYDAPSTSLMNSMASLKMKTTKGEGVKARSLARSTLKVEGRVGALGRD
jgi:hypothetical protein